MKVVILQEFDPTILQNLGVQAPAAEPGLNCPDTLFGLIKSSRNLPLPELPVRAIFETGKSQDKIEFLTMQLELIVPPGKTNGSEEGSDEAEHVICTLISPL